MPDVGPSGNSGSDGGMPSCGREIARCFLAGAGITIPGEMARAGGLSRPEAGRGNRALVAEGYTTMPASGVYHLATRGAL